MPDLMACVFRVLTIIINSIEVFGLYSGTIPKAKYAMNFRRKLGWLA